MSKEDLIKLLLQIAKDCGLLDVVAQKFIPAVIQALIDKPQVLAEVIGLITKATGGGGGKAMPGVPGLVGTVSEIPAKRSQRYRR